MNIVGIVVEYNPFHNGHKIHIEKSKKYSNADIVIAFMSGNFVQRGNLAIFDKWTRTKVALLNGVDIVIEIPIYFACSSAEYFCECAIRLMENTGIINTISFGSEIGNINYMDEIANILVNEPQNFKNILKYELSRGLPYPVARLKAIKKIFNHNDFYVDEILKNPNNILGIEYLKALKKINSTIKPITIKRENSSYNSKIMQGKISSATSIRESIKNNNINGAFFGVPKNCIDIYKNALDDGIAPIFTDYISDFLNYKLRISSPEYISNILDINEGLENKIYKSLSSNYNFYDLCNAIKSKRYTYTKIQRALIHIILDITKYDTQWFIENGFSQYIRILGFNRKVSDIVGKLSKNSLIPVITNIKNAHSILDEHGIKMLNKEIHSTDIYMALNPNIKKRELKKEYTTPMVII